MESRLEERRFPQRRGVVASTRDGTGVEVVLTGERWGHIVEGHGQLAGLQAAVMEAVQNADRRCEGNVPGREKLYCEDLGPARWLAVVVDYNASPAWIVTAYPCSKLPKNAT